MPLAAWFQPARRTLTVFLCLMSVLAGALGWLAWQAIERERLVERRQAQDRVERAADRIVAALGLPAALTAAEARCTVLEAMGRTDELRQEAARMASLLWSGRLALLRPAWEFHLEEARRWGADGPPAPQQRQAFALSSAAQ